MITDTQHRHDTIAAAVLAGVVGLAGLAALLTVALDATGHPVLVGVALVLTAVAVGVVRRVARCVRERRENAADALAGAAWRAQNMPRHFAAQLDRDRAGVS